jgi:hypothetical protein
MTVSMPKVSLPPSPPATPPANTQSNDDQIEVMDTSVPDTPASGTL